MMRRLMLIACLCLSSLACSEGRLVMELELPGDPTLDPTLECHLVEGQPVCDRQDPRISRFSLRLSDAEGLIGTQDAAATGAELTVGLVPVDRPFDLRLAATTVTGQILGLGLVRDVVVSADEETRVAIKLRKPIAYVGGGPELRVLDMAAARGRELRQLAIGGVADVAAVPNGVLVAAAVGNKLLRLRTSDHLSVGCNAPPQDCLQAVDLALPDPATCVAVTADSSRALVCHTSGLSVVSGLADNAPRVTAIDLSALGKPTRIALDSDGELAWVLLDGIEDPDECGGSTSKLVRIGLTPNGAEPPGTLVDLGQPAADVAVDPLDDGTPLVALPCGGGALGRVAGEGGLGSTLALPPSFDLALVERNVIVVGAVADEPSQTVQAQVSVIDRSDRATPALPGPEQVAPQRIDLPPVEVGVVPRGGNVNGFMRWVSEPKTAAIREVKVSPDGQRALLLVRASYASDLALLNCNFRATIDGWSYLVVDLEAGSVLFSRFALLGFSQCEANCVSTEDGRSLIDFEVCSEVFTQNLSGSGELTQPQFEPRGASLLFGSE